MLLLPRFWEYCYEDGVAVRNMVMWMRDARRLWLWLLGVLLLYAAPGHAQNQGFQINRYEPTAAGQWSLWVDHPYYSSIRYFAAGITLNYAHQPLIFSRINTDGSISDKAAVIENQLIGHIDLAGSFLDRVLLTASLPVVFWENGSSAGGAAPADQVTVSDLRFGAMVRLWGQPYRSPFSIHIGGEIWVPLRKFSSSLPMTASDKEVRGLPKLVLGGLTHSILWSFTGGVLVRPEATLGDPGLGATAEDELQFGAAVAYASTKLRLSIGPEFVAATAILGKNAFRKNGTSMEAMLGLHYNIAKLIQLSLGGGFGILRQPGTPDGRVLLRVAYAPFRDEKTRAVVVPDRDGDGVPDEQDLCPDTHKGWRPDRRRPGCPAKDRDGDGILDNEDQCPDNSQGLRADPNRPGCPMGDRDNDGVLDGDDFCPDVPQGLVPDPQKKGCPAEDRDKDGIFDHLDKCPDVRQGLVPDPQKMGCPAEDRDHDTVPDPLDACPDKAGAPHPDAKKNGCPGLVTVENGKINILLPVFFATNRDVILKKSFPVLQAVGDALLASPQIKKIRIEGHSDNRGKVDYNTDLSRRRAQSVMQWLNDHSIDESRLEAEGYGPTRPIADNNTEANRAKNRRVDFVIIDPPQLANIKTADPKTISVPDSPDQSDKSAAKPTKNKPQPRKARTPR